jgi:uncharacterized damage-inducible protein DinB
MNLISHFAMLARYNRIANERLYEACACLSDAEYTRSRAGSFGSIHGLLNHTLLSDRIWMARFTGEGGTTPPLDTVLSPSFGQLRPMRQAEDRRIEDFFSQLDGGFLQRRLAYTNSKGVQYSEEVPVAAAHFFNHQTHHRGQVHIMLSQASLQPPSLDLHRIINP